MTATSTCCFSPTNVKKRTGWVSSLCLQLSLESQSHRPQTSQGVSAMWSLLFSTIKRYNISMLWLDTIPMCKGDLAGAVSVFIAALFACIVALSQTEAGQNAPCRKLCWLLLIWSIWFEVFEWLPRPQAAAAAMRAILAWVSSLTSVHSSQHCWCNWPLENINHRLQTTERICSVPCSQWW